MNLSPHLVRKILGLPRWKKRGIVVIVDVVIGFASVLAAFYLRLGTWPTVDGVVLRPVIFTIATIIPLLFMFGAYRAIFRYTGAVSLLLTLKVSSIYAMLFALVFVFVGIDGVPRTVGLIQPILMILMLISSRLAASSLLGRSIIFPWQQKDLMPVVMIYGAGSAGRQLASAIRLSGEMILTGFIDDDPLLQNGIINGVKVYDPADLQSVVLRHKVTDILLALPSATRARKSAIVHDMRGLNLHVRTLPGVIDLARGNVSVKDLKELEIEDLLGRSTVPPDHNLLTNAITGRIILVTGAGGSIGSEICRQIASTGPSILILVDNSEFMLYSIHQELSRLNPPDQVNSFQIVPLLASVTDPIRMSAIISTWRPQCIFHAAAYKHVPLVEENLVEGVRNNVFGTLNMADIAARHEVESFILISTDKAVRPTNIMGASKRFAELILQAKHAQNPSQKTRFSMVRFGNVLGSNGSVVPLFRRQIEAGGPITVTHPDVIRYFMTIPEAAQLVIQAGAMSVGGEVFVLDMGEPVRIVDLARNMIELSGMSVQDEDNDDGDIAINIVGLRPGEKLYEELLIGDNAEETDHPRILQAQERFIPWDELEQHIVSMQAMIESHSENGVKDIIKQVVKEYTGS